MQTLNTHEQIISSSPFTISIVSYNLLSGPYALPKDYPQCDPQDLDSDTRLLRVKTKLHEQMEQNAVVCLQELCRDWAGALVPFFDCHNYTCVHGLYGDEWSGYMGTALAWPRYRYIATDVVIKRLSETGQYSHDEHSEAYAPWIEAKKKSNVVILALLQSVTSPHLFCVGTYHMPCLYGSDNNMQIMNLHASMLMHFSQIFANGKPLIVAGDFNFYPGDSTYHLLTHGTLPSYHPQDIQSPELKCELTFHSMRSAYNTFGGEPEFTSLTCWKNGETSCEIMDYIFISEHWGVRWVKYPTEDMDSMKRRGVKSLPTATEPSDHILIGATLDITSARM